MVNSFDNMYKMNSSFCPIIKLEGKVLLNQSESQVYVLLLLLSISGVLISAFVISIKIKSLEVSC